MSLPLIAIPARRGSSLFDAALAARRALCQVEARGAEATEVEMAAARQRVLAQLASVASCIEAMAETGMLHANLDVMHTMQTRACQEGLNGEWLAETVVTRVPPRPLIAVTWPPELCTTVMTASVILNVVARDHPAELIEYRHLAALVLDRWAEPGAALATRLADEWVRSGTRCGDERCGDEPDSSPWRRAVHLLHSSLRDGARDCHPPEQVEVGSVHALDFARRTLQWIGFSASSLGEAGDT
jgi:hypothetical protein